MHTKIDIDTDLLTAALLATGLKTKREVGHEGLARLIADAQRVNLLQFDGQIAFAADYDYKALRQGGDDRR